MSSGKNSAYLNRIYSTIDSKLWQMRNELIKSAMNKKCLVFVARALKEWPGTVKYFTKKKRKQISDMLVETRWAVEEAGAIENQINEIIRLLLPPTVETVCIDIEELWMCSGGDEETKNKLQMT